ncbi:TPA: hypothetical protein AB5F35_003534, partial [Vibrio cholerae]
VVVFKFSGMRCQPLRRALCIKGGILDLSKLMDYLAIYASVTATLTLMIQAASYLNNRARIRLSSRMLIECRPGYRVDGGGCLVGFEITILNNGERVAYIEEVGILYYGNGFVHRLNPMNKGNKFLLFSDSPVRAITEKQNEKFKVSNIQLSYIAELMGEKEVAYVRLSSGKVVKMKFKTTSLSREGFSLDSLKTYA